MHTLPEYTQAVNSLGNVITWEGVVLVQNVITICIYTPNMSVTGHVANAMKTF